MANEEAGAAGQQAADPNQKQVGMQRIYMKDASFEAPNAPAVFAREWKPQVNLNISASNTQLDTDTFEVVLTVTAEAKLGEENAFLCEVHQAGVFILRGLTPEELKAVIGSFCPSQLFPFAREAISDLVGKGGFPQLMLQPINFDAMLQQHAQQQAAAQAEAQGGEPH